MHVSRSLATLRGLAPKRRLASASIQPSASYTNFYERWRSLTPPERDRLAAEFEVLQKGDWRALTHDQKKILYTLAYGVPEVKDPKEGWKIAGLTLALIGVAAGLFAFVRSFANPPPKTTYDKNWEAASIKLQEENNSNPISGVAAKKREREAAAADNQEIVLE